MKQKSSEADVRISKFLSLVLRHDPSAAKLQLDEQGWVDVSALLRGFASVGRPLSREHLDRIVAENEKKRFEFDPSGQKIRACQGHSVEVDLQLEPIVPPDILYHGTTTRFLDSILQIGILKQARQHVHLSDKRATATQVGQRHGKPVILEIQAARMATDGFIFYRSHNGVWLTDHVPAEYLSISDENS